MPTDREHRLHAEAQARYAATRADDPEYIAARKRIKAEHRKRYPERNAARVAVYRAVKSGQLVKPELCERCNTIGKPVEASHNDYSRPLEVEWLCRQCHARKDRSD